MCINCFQVLRALFTVRFRREADGELIDWIAEQEGNFTQYVKKLIQQDMEKKENDEKK